MDGAKYINTNIINIILVRPVIVIHRVSYGRNETQQADMYTQECIGVAIGLSLRGGLMHRRGLRWFLIISIHQNYRTHKRKTNNTVITKITLTISNIHLILELILKKCIPILTYGLEVCALLKRVLQSLDFTVNRVVMKLFKSSNIVIEQCRYFFHIEMPSVQLQRLFEKFLADAAHNDKVS